jgi:hypothetical protein
VTTDRAFRYRNSRIDVPGFDRAGGQCVAQLMPGGDIELLVRVAQVALGVRRVTSRDYAQR